LEGTELVGRGLMRVADPQPSEQVRLTVLGQQLDAGAVAQRRQRPGRVVQCDAAAEGQQPPLTIEMCQLA
jgi:hypothetical protein